MSLAFWKITKNDVNVRLLYINTYVSMYKYGMGILEP